MSIDGRLILQYDILTLQSRVTRAQSVTIPHLNIDSFPMIVKSQCDKINWGLQLDELVVMI